MPVVQIVSQRHELLIPAIVPRLVASDQQDGDTPRVESVQYSIGPPSMLNPQLPHVPVARVQDRRTIGMAELRPTPFEQFYVCRNRFLLVFRQAGPPRLEVVGVLDLPLHGNMPYMEYSVKGMSSWDPITATLLVGWRRA